MPPLSPLRLLPRVGMDYALKVSGLASRFKLDAGAEKALQELYDEFLGNAISFGCSNAKRRKVTCPFHLSVAFLSSASPAHLG